MPSQHLQNIISRQNCEIRAVILCERDDINDLRHAAACLLDTDNDGAGLGQVCDAPAKDNTHVSEQYYILVGGSLCSHFDATTAWDVVHENGEAHLSNSQHVSAKAILIWLVVVRIDNKASIHTN